MKMVLAFLGIDFWEFAVESDVGLKEFLRRNDSSIWEGFRKVLHGKSW